MKLFSRRLCVGLLSLLFFVTTFGMQQQVLPFAEPGILDRLMIGKYTNERIIIFGSLLGSKEINVLRRTSKKLSEFFSFCKPSRAFIACNNEKIHKKDYKNIFFTALYDGDCEIASLLIHKDKINRRYRIAGTAYALYPNQIVSQCNDQKMSNLLITYESAHIQNKTNTEMLMNCVVNPLLIACISRNSKRVELVLTDYLMDDSLFLQVINTVINNSDTQTLELMLNNKKTQKYIKNNGAKLIKHAIACGSRASCKTLIASNLCNINQIITPKSQFIDDEFVYVQEFNDFSNAMKPFTLLDAFYEEQALFKKEFGEGIVGEIKDMLIEGGAKTLEELAIDGEIDMFTIVS